MRIEGSDKTSSLKGVSKSKKKEGSSGVSFSSLIDEADEALAASDVAPTAAIGSLDALLAVQEDEGKGSKEANENAKQRAGDLLDNLEDIRTGLLMGGISINDLNKIAETVSRYMDRDIDPKLASLLDEIDLRVQVELAKLNM